MNPSPPAKPAESGFQPTEYWGETDYATALEQQLARVAARKAGNIPDTLIVTTHPPVYTLGRRSGASQHLIADSHFLTRHNIAVHESNRGGDITYHGPGQIVFYPIIDLNNSRDLHRYLRFLEEVILRTLRQFGLPAWRVDGKTGIWCAGGKIAAIGVAVKTWITYHGAALNVEPDLEHFSGIVPCGLHNSKVTSLAQELTSAPTLEIVTLELVKIFWETHREFYINV